MNGAGLRKYFCLAPEVDESLSSWLIRLAWRSGYGPLEGMVAWTNCRSFWSRDVDLNMDRRLLLQLQTRFDLPAAALAAASLRERLGLRDHSTTRPPGVMPVSRGMQTDQLRCGQMYCPLCLEADAAPHFRLEWRLATVIACSAHRVFLRDRCPACSAPVRPWASPRGRHLCCWYCRLDLRRRRPVPLPTDARLESYVRRQAQLLDCPGPSALMKLGHLKAAWGLLEHSATRRFLLDAGGLEDRAGAAPLSGSRSLELAGLEQRSHQLPLASALIQGTPSALDLLCLLAGFRKRTVLSWRAAPESEERLGQLAAQLPGDTYPATRTPPRAPRITYRRAIQRLGLRHATWVASNRLWS